MKYLICIALGVAIGFGLGQVHKNDKAKETTVNIEKSIKNAAEPAIKNGKQAIKNAASEVANSL